MVTTAASASLISVAFDRSISNRLTHFTDNLSSPAIVANMPHLAHPNVLVSITKAIRRHLTYPIVIFSRSLLDSHIEEERKKIQSSSFLVLGLIN
ncbi:hypothetical protein Bca4012_025202 [Brassica carinata]|uniref:Uncharacterized protein n=1 Tax=Brassica carinata TaxID=52824 RepID=A0A8X7VGS4_BRACI|nr:hypothetical protein Bca52824_022252 [Brassica carinata]